MACIQTRTIRTAYETNLPNQKFVHHLCIPLPWRLLQLIQGLWKFANFVPVRSFFESFRYSHVQYISSFRSQSFGLSNLENTRLKCIHTYIIDVLTLSSLKKRILEKRSVRIRQSIVAYSDSRTVEGNRTCSARYAMAGTEGEGARWAVNDYLFRAFASHIGPG